MESTTWSQWRLVASLGARLVLAAVFALSAIAKLTAPGFFHDSVAAYHLLPTGLVGPFAQALPWVEALIALYLLIGLFLRPTAVATAVLLLVFIVALSISLARGNTAHGCGCLPSTGPLGSLPFVAWLAGGATITPFDVVRDLVFLGLAGIVFWWDRFTLSLDGLLFRPSGGYDGDPADDELEAKVAAAPSRWSLATYTSGEDAEQEMSKRRAQ